MPFVQLQNAVASYGTLALRYPSALTRVFLKRNSESTGTVPLPYGGCRCNHDNGTAAEAIAANASQVCS
jgi:hypothetical protein